MELTLALLALVGAARAQWVEPRTVFRGEPAERLAAIPYYYPYAEDPDFAWGFFYDYGRLPAQYRGEAYQRACFRQMREAGLNTVTVYGWHGAEDVADLAEQLRWAQSEGLIGTQPVPLLPCGDPGKVMAALRPLLSGGLPPLWGYGPDEPAATEEARAGVEASANAWRAAGLKCVSAISADSAPIAGGALDAIMVHAPGLSRAAPREGQELWMYDCELRGTNRELHRYWAGVYSYAANRRLGVRSAWLWSYVNDANSGAFREADGSLRWNPLRVCEHALPGPDAPLWTVGLEGIREGVRDFGLLRECERRGVGRGWVEWLVSSVELDFWNGTDQPGGPRGYFWDVPDVARPLIDCAEVREKCCGFLMQPAPD